ncbi:hypothetical protein CSB45_08015 [candidate division KSB3 bacterium]|uniref:Uncharacterized protein n=1 Tax=candidate division KSB3 bacterium TaxID=2044937 RepID=A0A2G6E522_9BACT|nr:MAG: hypothetical protein CSB45_08015 [candidate division KSB3 bacterium]PIE29833.1 MAG: hypothetical protein CSA57_07205 [candidate division KSB3 bacterium]
MDRRHSALQFAQQLEDVQTTRKAKDVSEISQFNSGKEELQQRRLIAGSRMEQSQRNSLCRELEQLDSTADSIICDKTEQLRELAEFERQLCNMRIPDPECGVRTDAFAHDLYDLTGQELQKELDHNQKALQDSSESSESPEPPREPSSNPPGLQRVPPHENVHAEQQQHSSAAKSEKHQGREEKVLHSPFYFRSVPSRPKKM